MQGTENNEPGSFRILAPTLEDVVLLEAGPWWTPKHTFTLLGGIAFAAVLTSAWVSSMRRQIRAQTETIRKHQKELLETSRQAGMAEVATSVLHNVGNVLNSVNVSADVLRQHLHGSRLDGLGRVAELLQSHGADLAQFLTASPQGKALPGYLRQLADHLRGEKDVLVGEVAELSARIDHMKDIVDRQQSYARCSGVTTQMAARELAQEAIEMQRIPLQQAGIAVRVDVVGDDDGEFDRARVLQILMNVLGNARHAIRDTGRGEGSITIGVTRDGDRLRFRVQDDGVGIAADGLERVFQHGFTTKQDGHGFGLHHSANAATEMGGRMWAESAGKGHGATFVLELPIHRASEVTA